MAWVEKYVSVAGAGTHDGTSEANAWTLAEAIAAYAGGQRINVLKGTYTAAARNWNLAGTVSSGSWWRGYDTVIGDIDSNNALTKPIIQAGTNTQTLSGAHHLFSNLDISGNPAGTLLSVTGAHVHLDKIRAENTDSGVASYTVRASANGFAVTESWLKAHVSSGFVMIAEERGGLDHVVLRGGKIGLLMSMSATPIIVNNCIFDDQADSYGIDVTNGTGDVFAILNCTFYGAGSHGIRISATQPAFALIRGNIFVGNGGYGLSTVSGTVRVARLRNDFYSNTSGKENGMGDWPSLHEQTESDSPFVNAVGHDFRLVSTANAVANGGNIENESYQTSLDIGAVQRQEVAGGGSNFSTPLLN